MWASGVNSQSAEPVQWTWCSRRGIDGVFGERHDDVRLISRVFCDIKSLQRERTQSYLRRDYKTISMCQENVTFLKKFLASRVLRGRVVFFEVKVARLCLYLPMAQETLKVVFFEGMVQDEVKSWYSGYNCV